MRDNEKTVPAATLESDDLTRFTDSYESFNRIINSLQRKYIELKDEFSAQNEQLVTANKKLVELTEQNITVTEFLNGILNSISAGVIAVDHHGKITHFNPAASQILGIPVQQPAGKLYRDCILPGDKVEANALRTIETGKEIESVEKTIVLPDKSKLQLSVSTAIVRDPGGAAVGAVEVFQDLTKFKKMEFEIARLNTLAALGEMAATIAHEVRNPIAGIGGFAALLNRDFKDDDPNKELVSKIIDGVNNLNVTIDTLLNYTRFEEIQKKRIDYITFVQDTVEQFQVDYHERIEHVSFDLHLPTKDEVHDELSVHIDQMLFRQIFFNLYKNSLEAFDDAGEIKIHVKKLSRQKALELYADQLLLGLDETIIETTVTDSGTGIPEDKIKKIFSPFFTTKSEGSGLGLAVAWKIVKTHGGDMMVEKRKKGEGASFKILLSTRIHNTQGVT